MNRLFRVLLWVLGTIVLIGVALTLWFQGQAKDDVPPAARLPAPMPGRRPNRRPQPPRTWPTTRARTRCRNCRAAARCHAPTAT